MFFPPATCAGLVAGPTKMNNARNIAELLSRTCRERGKTLILVTHDRQMIRPVDRVFEMRHGSLTMTESVLAP